MRKIASDVPFRKSLGNVLGDVVGRSLIALEREDQGSAIPFPVVLWPFFYWSGPGSISKPPFPRLSSEMTIGVLVCVTAICTRIGRDAYEGM